MKFLKEQEARGWLSSLGIRTDLSQIVIYKFMPKMHSIQPGFTYACGPFTKNKE